MSNHKLLILSCFLCGCLAAAFLAIKGSGGREPASLVSNHAHNHQHPSMQSLVQYPNERTNVEKIMQLRQDRMNHSFTKLKKPITVKISLMDEKIEVGEVFTLRAEVSAKQLMNQNQFTWSFDPSLEVVSGSVSGSLNELSPSETKVIELVLKAHQKKSTTVFLNVFSEETGFRIGANGYISTGPYMDLPAAVTSKNKSVKIPVKRVIY